MCPIVRTFSNNVHHSTSVLVEKMDFELRVHFGAATHTDRYEQVGNQAMF
jgi:hypothetical protein